MVSSIEARVVLDNFDSSEFYNQSKNISGCHTPYTVPNSPRDGESSPLRRKSSEEIVPSRGYAFMLLLTFQYGLQPLLQKSCIDRENVSKISVVLATELMKIILCSLALFNSGMIKDIKDSWTLKDSLKYACLPAILYAIQNWLTQIAYMNLDSLTFILLNQLKTLSAAVCLYVVMGKRQSKMQILALGILLTASIVLNIRDSNSSDDTSMNWEYGILPVLGASFLSGLSAAIVQRSVQTKGRNSFLLSAELGVFGIIAVLSTTLLSSNRHLWTDGLWKGWTPYTFIPVFTNGLGGLFVGQVTKHAGSIKKGFALMAGIFVTAVAQFVLEEQPLNYEHYGAATLVAFSMYLHSKFPYQKAKRF